MRLLLLLPAVLRSVVAYTALSDNSLSALPSPGADFDIYDGALLSPILIPRVPGTEGSEKVLNFFVDFFSTQLPEWHISIQNSTSTTPTSNGQQVPFRNFIATRDPPWVERSGEAGRLALVAHYDSLQKPAGFIGATDSAAPCAMLLHAARSIDAALTAKWTAEKQNGDDLEDLRGVQILLLDGEEAFLSWTDTDSLYGARALAEEWEQTFNPAMSTYSTPLASIDLFVLLDLLGSPPQRVPSYFKTTHWAYQHMAHIETRLRKLGLFKSGTKHGKQKGDSVFLHEADKKDTDRWIGGYIGDDHVPFLARGVEVLHIIPSPFPYVWHKKEDDGEHLNIDVVQDWAMLVTAFAAEWMDLQGYMGSSGKGSNGSRERDELPDQVP